MGRKRSKRFGKTGKIIIIITKKIEIVKTQSKRKKAN